MTRIDQNPTWMDCLFEIITLFLPGCRHQVPRDYKSIPRSSCGISIIVCWFIQEEHLIHIYPNNIQFDIYLQLLLYTFHTIQKNVDFIKAIICHWKLLFCTGRTFNQYYIHVCPCNVIYIISGISAVLIMEILLNS